MEKSTYKPETISSKEKIESAYKTNEDFFKYLSNLPNSSHLTRRDFLKIGLIAASAGLGVNELIHWLFPKEARAGYEEAKEHFIEIPYKEIIKKIYDRLMVENKEFGVYYVQLTDGREGYINIIKGKEREQEISYARGIVDKVYANLGAGIKYASRIHGHPPFNEQKKSGEYTPIFFSRLDVLDFLYEIIKADNNFREEVNNNFEVVDPIRIFHLKFNLKSLLVKDCMQDLKDTNEFVFSLSKKEQKKLLYLVNYFWVEVLSRRKIKRNEKYMIPSIPQFTTCLFHEDFPNYAKKNHPKEWKVLGEKFESLIRNDRFPDSKAAATILIHGLEQAGGYLKSSIGYDRNKANEMQEYLAEIGINMQYTKHDLKQ